MGTMRRTPNTVVSRTSLVDGWSPLILFRYGGTGDAFETSRGYLWEESTMTTPVIPGPDAVGTPIGAWQGLRRLYTAIQATSGDRPVLGRYPRDGIFNRFTFTEQLLTNWVNQGLVDFTNAETTVSEGVTLKKMVANTTETVAHRIYTETFVGGIEAGNYTISFIAKADEYSSISIISDNQAILPIGIVVDISAKTSSNMSRTIFEDRSDGSVRVTLSVPNATAPVRVYFEAMPSGTTRIAYSGNDNDGIFMGGVQIRKVTSFTAHPYQRVGQPYDISESGVPDVYYVSGNGSNSRLSIPNTASEWKFLHDGTGGTMAVAGFRRTNVGFQCLAGSYNSNSSASGAFLAANTNSGLRLDIGNDAAGQQVVQQVNIANGDYPPFGRGTIRSFYADQAGDDFFVHLNGTLRDSGGQLNPPSSGNAQSSFTLLDCLDTGDGPLNGGIVAAMVIDKRLSDSEGAKFDQWSRREMGGWD